MYANVLWCPDRQDLGQEESYRLKGVSKQAIKYAAQQQDTTGFELFKRLYDGEVINFDLCVNDELAKQGRLKKSKMFQYVTIDTFAWNVKCLLE